MCQYVRCPTGRNLYIHGFFGTKYFRWALFHWYYLTKHHIKVQKHILLKNELFVLIVNFDVMDLH